MIQLMIFSFWIESKMIFGAPKITKEFHKLGLPVAQKTVSKYMKELGIKACYIRPYVRTTTDPDFDESLKNLLQEQFNPEQPNALWCSDITYIHTEEGFVYLTSIMDLFSRKIIA